MKRLAPNVQRLVTDVMYVHNPLEPVDRVGWLAEFLVTCGGRHGTAEEYLDAIRAVLERGIGPRGLVCVHPSRAIPYLTALERGLAERLGLPPRRGASPYR